jgi:anaerobic selenocysteine-containing dehydrogenase
VIDRVGESRTNNELAAALAVRLGLDADEFDPDPARLSARMATDGPIDAVRVLRAPGETVQFVHTFPTFPDGRARLFLADGELPLPRHRPLDSGYPLTLISPATAKTINTMFGEFDPPPALLSLSPADASARGIVDDATVRVWNDQATITLRCTVDSSLREGVCSIPKGLWLRHVAGGRTANSLVPATLSDLAGGACFNDTRVEVAAVPESEALG